MNKQASLSSAVGRFVEDGQLIAIEGFGHLVPTAAAHEIIRQGFSGITLARMTGDVIVDQLIAADCVDTLITSFMANGSAGSLHEVRRRVEKKSPSSLHLEEYSHGGMVSRYIAGASKLPFYPLKSYKGSDLVPHNLKIKTIQDPYGGDDIHVVPALNPDVTIVHAQRADAEGNTQAWGMLGMNAEAAFAARTVIVTVEEIVDEEVVRSDPNRTIIPSQVVDAVVECPRGAHPHSVQGYYDRDDAYSRWWTKLASNPYDLRAWLNSAILGTKNHEEFLAQLGPNYWDKLKVVDSPSLPVNYGGRK